MKKDEIVYIKHIVDEIEEVERFLEGVEEREFAENRVLQKAVVRSIEVIGEAARLLSDEFKERYNNIPWKEMVGMRNKLIHEYFEVDLSLVWEVSQTDLPRLKELLMKIIVG